MKVQTRILHLGRFIARHERWLTLLLVLIAVVSMSVSAYLFRPNAQSIVHYRPTLGPKTFYPPTALLALLLGALALSFALLLNHYHQHFPEPQPPNLTRLIPQGWWPLLPGIALLGLVAEANGQWLGVEWLAPMHYHIQFVLLVAGTALVAMGLIGNGHHVTESDESDTQPNTPPISRTALHAIAPSLSLPRVRLDLRARTLNRELALIAGLTVVAFLVRLWHLDTAVRMMIDEAHFTMGVTYFWSYDDVKILAPMPTTASFPFIFSYGMTWGVDIAGRTFAGLRLFSVLIGALTVPAVYLLGRYLYDRTTALIAALFLLSFPPHIHYSRLALNNIADPLAGTLALGLIARALHTSRRTDYVLAGIALGFTQYFYEGGRLLFPLLALVWLGVGFVLWRPQPSVRGVILLLVAFAIVAAPIYYTLIGLDFPLLDRLDKTHLDDVYWGRDREENNWLSRVRHFHHALMMYVHMPENTLVYYYLYYGGEHGLVLEYLVPILLLGLVITLWRWWTPGVLPAGWILANALGNASLVESAVTARYVLTFPAVALLIGVGLRYTLGLLWPDSDGQPEQNTRVRLRNRLLIAAAAIIAGGQIVFYYRDHLPLFEREMREPIHHDVEDALWRARHFPPGTHVHLIGDRLLPQPDAQRFANFIADDLVVQNWDTQSLNGIVLADLARNVNHAFFMAPDDFNTQRLLVAYFGPAPITATDQDIPAEKGLLLYYLPALE